MTTEADIGYGTLFKTLNGDGVTYTTFAEVTNITEPQLSRDSIDASHEQSPDQFREFIAGMVDGGEVSLEFNLVPGGASMTDIVAEFSLTGPSATKTRRIEYPNGSYWDFSAFATGFQPQSPLDAKRAGSATFKVSGKPTLTVV